MTSTELSMGLPDSGRPTSRVLKPPGGGHTNLFGDSDVRPNPPRQKYDQQNSSNLNFVMNTVDPSESGKKAKAEAAIKAESEAKSTPAVTQPMAQNTSNDNSAAERVRVPPGGFSSGGFW